MRSFEVVETKRRPSSKTLKRVSAHADRMEQASWAEVGTEDALSQARTEVENSKRAALEAVSLFWAAQDTLNRCRRWARERTAQRAA